MKIAILGFGSQGNAALLYWRQLDPANQITVCDRNEATELPDGVAGKLGDNYLADLDTFDLLVRSPSLHPRDIVAANPDAPDILKKVTTVTNEFFRVSPTKNIIGVTGTKGKGTTCSLILEILKTAGKTAYLGGNFGTPPLELLEQDLQPTDWVILELANFQLIDLAYSPPIAVCVMVAPEHLDWHTDIEEYVTAKSQMFVHQKTEDLAVFNRLNERSRKIASVSPGIKISYEVPEPGDVPLETTGAYVKDGTIYMNDVTVCETAEVSLRGHHNIQNVCAAIAATWEVINGDTEVIKKAVHSLKGLPNRIEPIRVVNEVTYYNDSFAAAPGATVAALDAIPEPKVAIIGGFDRMLPLEELIASIQSHEGDIRKLLLIGAAADRVAKECTENGLTNFEITEAKTMPEIVTQAAAFAQPGDVVILSPGFPSFDMFANFAERGKEFRRAVEKL